MPTGTLSHVISIAGLSISGTTNRTDAGQISQEVTLAAGKSGTLTTRTDNDTGVITSTAHGITDADTVNVFWAVQAGQATAGNRMSMTVTGYAANTINIDLGTGDNLPIEGATVMVSKQTIINTDFDGDLMKMFVAHCSQNAQIDVQDVGNATLLDLDLTANEPFIWVSDQGITRPITGNPVDEMRAGVNSTTAGTLKIGVLYDSDA